MKTQNFFFLAIFLSLVLSVSTNDSGTISTQVYDTNGAPIDGAKVTIISLDNEISNCITGVENPGECLRTGLESQTYIVEVNRNGYLSKRNGNVIVRNGEITTERFVLDSYEEYREYLTKLIELKERGDYKTMMRIISRFEDSYHDYDTNPGLQEMRAIIG